MRSDTVRSWTQAWMMTRRTQTYIVLEVWLLVPKGVLIFRQYYPSTQCQLAWERCMVNLTHHRSLCISLHYKYETQHMDAGHRAAVVDRCMTDLCTRKEGQSIHSYWSPRSMKGQRIPNAEATSQHLPIALWCDSSVLQPCKNLNPCLWQRKTALLLAPPELHSWISPTFGMNIWAFTCVLLSLRWQDSPPF